MTSALLAGLLITSSLLSPAYGEERVFQPKGAWALTKVDRTAQGGNSYCTLSRIYDDGIVLSLGRNQTEEYSLAVDFQKDVFNRDKAMQISLQPGPGQVRAYDMMPTSNKAVVIRLGWDTGFFSSLNSSQQVKIKLDNQNYTFALPEITKGQAELTTCMEGLKGGKAASASDTKDVLEAETGSADKTFGAEKADTKNASYAQQKEFAAAPVKVADNTAANLDKITPSSGTQSSFVPRPPSAKPDVNVDEADKLKSQQAQLEKKIKQLQDENKGLQSVAKDAAKSGEVALKKDAEKNAQQLASLNTENAALKQKVSAFDDTKKQLAALRVENDALKKTTQEATASSQKLASISSENEALKKQTIVLQGAQKDIAALKAENEALKQKNSDGVDVQARLATMAAEKTAMEKRVAALEEEKRKSDQTADAAKAAMTSSYQKTASDINALQQKINQLQAQNDSLTKSSSSSVSDAQKDLAAALGEKKALETKLAALVQENEVNEKAATAAATGMDTLRHAQGALEEKTRNLEQQVAALTTENATLKTSIPSKETTAQSTAALATAQQQIASLTAENASLKQKMPSIEELSAAKQKTQTLEQTVAGLTAENAILKKGLPDKQEIANTASKAAELQKQVAALNAENASLKQKIPGDAETAAQVKQLKELQLQVASLTTENTTLKKDVSGKNALTEKTAQIADLQKQVATVSAENQTLKAAAAKPAADATASAVLQKQVGDLTAENAALKQQVQDQTAKIAAAATPAAGTPAAPTPEAAAQLADLQKQNKDLQDKVASLENGPPMTTSTALMKAQAKVSELQTRNAQLEDTLRQSQVRIGETAINTENKSIKKIMDLEAKLDSAQKDNVTLAKQIEDLRLQQENTRMASVAGNPTLESATKRYNEAEREIQRLGQAIEEQKTTCTSQKAEIENMLFDPAVTEQKQQEKLATLEQQLNSAQDAIKDQQKLVQYAVDQGVAEKTKAMEAEKAALLQQVAALKSGNGSAAIAASAPSIPASISGSGGDIDALNKQAAEYQSLVATYKTDNDKLTAEAEQLRKQVAALSTQKPVAVAPKPENDAKVSELTRQVQSLQDKLKKSEQAQNNAGSTAVLAAMQPAAGVPSMDMSAAPRPSAPKKFGVEAALRKAGLNVIANPTGKAFSWKDRAVSGTATIVPMSGNVDTMAQKYIAQQKARCSGDFASMPSSGSVGKAVLYETACVGSNQGSSASLAFYEDQGQFVAISNQTDAANMDSAMDLRDQIAKAL